MSTLNEIINLDKFQHGQYYSRSDIASLVSIEAIKTSREGIIQFKNCIILFITLDKSDFSDGYQYKDEFDGDTLRMDSQSSNTQSTPVIQRFINDEQVILFSRLHNKVDNLTQPFLYCGRLKLKSYFGNKPVRLYWQLEDFSQISTLPAFERLCKWNPIGQESNQIDSNESNKWVTDIVDGLETLGGIAKLAEIYTYIENNYPNRTLTKSWKNTIRFYIETHSSSSEAFQRYNNPDLFYSVEGKGKGIWGLRNYQGNKVSSPEFKIVKNKEFSEGIKTRILVNSYERDSRARNECIEHHGYKCGICEFDFQKTYGILGKNFIFVHHIKPLFCRDGNSYQPDPVNDLLPLCGNCHVMVHRSVNVSNLINDTVLNDSAWKKLLELRQIASSDLWEAPLE